MTDELYIVGRYIQHILKAKGRHSIQSPFLFDLYESCITNKDKSLYHKKIEIIRKRLLADDTIISINDLGAGSRAEKSRERKISEIAKHSLKSAKEAQFLSCFAKKIGAKNIIELGSSLGLTTARIALDNPATTINTIEGCKNIAAIANANFKLLSLKNIRLHIGDFDDILPKLLETINPDIIFIDGNHREDATIRYFEMAINSITPPEFIIFDDIYWSEGMTKAWQSIINNTKVSLSIDLFHLGIISLNQDFSKQDFILRF